ncbi:MAG: pyrimidine dimer DNA glycosylase/endonuclease V [Candidatus Absconditicoccaceae bacterium]
MTRINLLPPSQLADQHLIAEWRELPRVFGLVKKKLVEKKPILPGVKYTMGTGHVRFFYDKLLFLQKRHQDLVKEAQKRGFKLSKTEKISLHAFPKVYCQDFIPSEADLAISQQRIQEKLKEKPDFYTFYGELR